MFIRQSAVSLHQLNETVTKEHEHTKWDEHSAKENKLHNKLQLRSCAVSAE